MVPIVCDLRFAALMAALGAARLRALASDLEVRLVGLLSAVVEGAGSRDAFIRRTHRDRGAASTLGFLALAEALEGLERALAREGGTAAAVAEVRQAQALASDALAKALDAAAADQAAGRPSL